MDLFFTKMLLSCLGGLAVFVSLYAFLLSRKAAGSREEQGASSRWSPLQAFVISLMGSFVFVTVVYLAIVL